MPCPECAKSHQRAARAEEAERLLLLFTDTIAKLTKSLAEIEAEFLRQHYANSPPPPDAAPVRRRPIFMSEDSAGEQPVSDPASVPA